MKLCNKCGELKEEGEYEFLRILKSGEEQYSPRCRACRNEERRATSKAWYERNAQYHSERVAENKRNAKPPAPPTASGRKRGRPAKPEEEKVITIQIALPPAQAAELLGIGDSGPSSAVRKLLAHWRARPPEDEA